MSKKAPEKAEGRRPEARKINKKICDWSKRDLKEHFDQLERIVERPRYACLKCGRAAAAKKWLCKAEALGG